LSSDAALWVTAERPDPRLSGGNIRQHHMLLELASRQPTDLLLVGDLLDGAPVAPALRSVFEIPTSPRRISENRVAAWGLNAYLAGPRGPWELYIHRPTIAAIRGFLKQHEAQYSLVVVEHTFLAPAGAFLSGTRSVLTMHNLASGAAQQELALVSGRRRWLGERRVVAWKKVERQAERDFDVVVTVSDSDAALLDGPSVLVPNGVDCSRFPNPPTRGTAGHVLFLGHLNFPPNVDGVAWMAEAIWPRVLQQVPTASLDVVGRDPNPQVRAAVAAMPTSTLHADVVSVDPHLMGAAVSVVPLRFGTGTRLKALEALAAGVPVVGTSVGLDGLGIVDGTHALVRDTANGLADGIASLLRDPARARTLAVEGQRLARNHFDWKPLSRHFADVATGVTE
jgi:glycosyltransferase involved in cell wall biosynthesis